MVVAGAVVSDESEMPTRVLYRAFRPAYELRGFALLALLLAGAVINWFFASEAYRPVFLAISAIAAGALLVRAVFYYRLHRSPMLVLDGSRLRFHKANLDWNLIERFAVIDSKVATGGVPFVGVIPRDEDALLSQAPPPVRALWENSLRFAGAPILVPPAQGMSIEELRSLLENYRAAVVGA